MSTTSGPRRLRGTAAGALAVAVLAALSTQQGATAGTKPEPAPAPLRPRATLGPTNDSFGAPQVLPGPSGSIGPSGQSNSGATVEAGEPQHKPGLAPHASIWFKWKSPVTGRVVFRTRGTGFDTILAAYGGSTLGSLTRLATNDDSPFNGAASLQSQVAFKATAGTTYRIAVDSFNPAATGPVRLSWTTNDDFAGAEQLLGPTPGQQLNDSSDTNGSTAQTGEPPHAGRPAEGSVWYSWTAPETAPARFGTFTNEFDTVLEAFTGSSLPNLTLVASNDDVQLGDSSSEIAFSAIKGTTYRISVSGSGQGTGSALLSYAQQGPSITIGDATVTEGNSGTRTLNLPVRLSAKSLTTVKVDFATVNGTATAGSDFVAEAGTLTFLPGETAKNVGVTVNGDTTHENQEMFTVLLSKATGGAAVFADDSGVGTINTDE